MRWSVWFLLIILLVIRLFSYYSSVPFRDGDRVRITSVVLEEPTLYSRSQTFDLEGLSVSIPKYPRVGYGDSIVVEGIVEGRKLKEVKLISVNHSQFVLLSLRSKIIGFYKNSLPIPDSTLVAGMVLGSKEGITQNFWDELTGTGTAHVVVASGMNVSLIGGFILSFFLLFLSRKKALIVTIIAIWVYVLISGFDAPIVRAAVMGSLAFLGLSLGRLSQTLRILIISALLMLLIKPLWLTDLGFIMSFLATLTVVLFSKKIEHLLRGIPIKIFRESLATSIAAQIGVGPILYFSFGQFNPFSPLINAAILWTVPLITVVSVISGLMSLVIEPLARLLLWTIYPLTRWFVTIVQFASGK